jgi:pimeloyl-ACP methyl ester carboxylesterase
MSLHAKHRSAGNGYLHSAMTLRTIEVGGYRMTYAEDGTGEHVLLLHGSLSDYRAWTGQLADLGQRFHVIAPSFRHCFPERWDGRGNDFNVAQHADDLGRLLEALGIRRVHVVGHSRGGAVALQLALASAKRVGSLVLADPGGLEELLPDTAEGRAMAIESTAMFERLRDDLQRGEVEEAARAFVDALGGRGAWDRRSAEQRSILLDNIVTGPHCAERPRFSRAQLAGLSVPILLITGARSPSRYAVMLAEFARLNPSVRGLVTIDESAHAMPRENPSAFNRAVAQFLSSLD